MAKLYYFSDVLCIWAYVAQVRLDEAISHFGDKIEVDVRFVQVFSDAHTKIEETWNGKSGYGRFNKHLQEVAEQFPHITLNERIWLDVRPRTSTAPHLFLKAVQIVEEDGNAEKGSFAKAIWNVRRAFFVDARDTSDWHVQGEIAEELGLDLALIEAKIRSAEAIARLDADRKLGDHFAVAGSPTFVMNEGRQKLYGNVGYRLIEANIEELLRKPSADEASWC